MSTHLQVILDDIEIEEIRAQAHEQRMTVTEWVRQALRAARHQQAAAARARKLAALDAASQHAFPVGDIEQLLAEIALGQDDGAR
jgi:hypothetical protein